MGYTLGKKPYQCSQCESDLIQNGNIIISEIFVLYAFEYCSHIGNRPYQCSHYDGDLMALAVSEILFIHFVRLYSQNMIYLVWYLRKYLIINFQCFVLSVMEKTIIFCTIKSCSKYVIPYKNIHDDD